MADNTSNNLVLSVRLDDPQTMHRHLRIENPHPQYVLINGLQNVTRTHVGLEDLNNVEIDQNAVLSNNVLAFNGSTWSPIDINILVQPVQASYSSFGVVRLATSAEISAGDQGPYVPTAYSVKGYCTSTFSVLGHTHRISDISSLESELNNRSRVGHVHDFNSNEIVNKPFVTKIADGNKESTTSIVTPKALEDYSIAGHTHSTTEVYEIVERSDDPEEQVQPRNLQEVLDNKSDIDHTHYVEDVQGLPVTLEALKPILSYWLQTGTSDEYGGVLYLPCSIISPASDNGRSLVVQWGRLEPHVEGGPYTMSFHTVNGQLLQMSPVFYVGLTTQNKSDGVWNKDNMLQLVSVDANGFSWYCQSFSSNNYAVGGYWLAIGLQTKSRTLSLEWGTKANVKSSTEQTLTQNASLQFVNMSRRDISYTYDCDFMLVNMLAASENSFKFFLNSFDANSNTRNCDWFTYGVYGGSASENTFNQNSVLWKLDSSTCNWGYGWDKFRISAGKSFVIQRGCFDVEEPKSTDGSDVITFDLPLPVTGIYHISYTIQNAKKQSPNSSSTEKNLSVDREVYTKQYIMNNSNIVQVKCRSMEYGTTDTNAHSYRVYWSAYCYVDETNTSYINGSSIATSSSDTSFKIANSVEESIGSGDITIKIPITSTKNLVWRFGQMSVTKESTMPSVYDSSKLYYIICRDIAATFVTDNLITSDFNCITVGGSDDDPGHYTANLDRVHTPPFYGNTGGIPVSVVMMGTELETSMTWMMMWHEDRI